MVAIIKDHAVVRRKSIIAAGAVVLSGTIVESGCIYAGIPALKIKEVESELRAVFERTARNLLYMRIGIKINKNKTII